jgi:hypothetical protein
VEKEREREREREKEREREGPSNGTSYQSPINEPGVSD